MVHSHTARKGATLAEIIVVLAVVAIISTVVISFSILVSQRTKISSAKLDAMNDVSLLESITEGWILRMENHGANIRTETNALIATVGEGIEEKEYTLTFTPPADADEGVLQGTLPDGELLTCLTKRVTDVKFDVMPGSHDTLYFGTVTATIPGLDKANPMTQTQTFCVNPHVGDTIGGGI